MIEPDLVWMYSHIDIWNHSFSRVHQTQTFVTTQVSSYVIHIVTMLARYYSLCHTLVITHALTYSHITFLVTTLIVLLLVIYPTYMGS